jgi:hypothetical protein
MKLRHALLLVCCLLLLSGCGRGPVDNEGPITAVRTFVAALEARDASAMLATLEPTEWRRELGPELRMYLGYLDVIALEETQYRVEEHSGEQAIVRVTGMLHVQIAERSSMDRQPFDLRIETIVVDGNWYLRSVQLPQLLVDR